MRKLIVAQDEAYVLVKETSCHHETCSICDGVGRIRLRQKEFVCPQCAGVGSQMMHTTSEWHARGPARLTDVSIRRTEDGVTEEYSYELTVGTCYGNSIRRMKLHREDIYDSCEEAEKEACRRNQTSSNVPYYAQKGVAL